jgi:uncharacterized protein (UPF0303 family)
MTTKRPDLEKACSECLAQEDRLIFSSFNRADALTLGLSILNRAKAYPDPVAVSVTINGVCVFRHFADGARLDSEYWLDRKRRSVELMTMSSLRFRYWLELEGQILEDRKVDPDQYALYGGGFPILLHGTGMVGSVCISGLPDHLADHQIVVDALSDLLRTKSRTNE